ncbi:14008_t:CDS:2 [Entrophospora sp. SA101]|nr:14008_t:CDS:2 [Entrophospora sp. SA101]
MGVRLPMYIAINNALSAVSYSANAIGTLVIGIPWAGKACKIYGFFDTFIISMSVTLIAVVAVKTYLKVIRSLYLDTGRYDYKIYLITIITALIISCIGLPSYGPSKYWCRTSPGEWSLAILLSLLISFTAILCLFCYSRIIYMIFTIKRPDSSVNGGRRGINNEQQKTATCKILIYTFNYLIQWTPTLPFILGVANSDDPIWVYYLYVLSTNIGSVSNAIQYIFNEKYYIIADGDSSNRGCDIADVGGDDDMNSANSGNNVNSGNNNIENGKSVVDESVGGREGGIKRSISNSSSIQIEILELEKAVVDDGGGECSSILTSFVLIALNDAYVGYKNPKKLLDEEGTKKVLMKVILYGFILSSMKAPISANDSDDILESVALFKYNQEDLISLNPLI